MASSIYVAGRNYYYDLGLGDNTQRNVFTQVPGSWLVYRSSEDSGNKFAVGIKSDGTLWGVGDNTYKQLGLAGASYTDLTQIGTDTDWLDVALGASHMLALKSDGTLWACGSNSYGRLGLGHTTSPVATLTQVGTDTDWSLVAAGDITSYAAKSGGALYAFGNNDFGQCGQGTTTSYYSSPQAVTLSAGVSALACGRYHVLAQLSDGTLWAWGYNNAGQLGLGDTTQRTSPVQVGTDTDWASITAGKAFSANVCGIKTDGTAWSWGMGTNHATGQPGTTNILTPTQIGTDTDWSTAAASSNGLLMLKTTGALYVVGSGVFGTLGNNSTSEVTSLTDITSFGITLPTGGTLDVDAAANTSILIVVIPVEIIEAPTELTVILPAYPAIEAPTRMDVVASAAYIEAPTQLAVVDMSGGLLNAPKWTARCLIDGVDVSASLTDVARVPFSEGGARLAELVIDPPSGTLAPLDYVGKTITLDYVPILGGVAVPMRLFTGRIDTPTYSLDTRLLSLSCVDDLQNRVAALDLDVIDALVGGRYSVSVQGNISDHWDYAQARLTTVAGSLDAGPTGGMRVTPWTSDTLWATFGVGNLIYPRSVLAYPQRSQIINQVQVTFDYRYARLRQRYTTVGWSGTLIDMAPCGYQYPKQQDIMGAAAGSGWTVTASAFWPAPAAIPHSSGGFIHPDDGAIDMAVLHLTQRHSQTVTESYSMPVSAPESVAANGTLPFELRGALESSFDGGAWESALDVAPLMPTGGEQDWMPDAPRTDADYAIQTLLDQANVKILGSHRGARVTNATLCNPDIDLDKRVAIATAEHSAEGKIVAGVHELNFNTGHATTEFTIACFGAGGAGIITPDTLDVPTAPDPAAETQDWPSAVPSLFVATYGVTPYSDSLMGLLLNPLESIFVQDIPSVGSKSFANPYYVGGSYPVQGFRVQMPGVDDADRNPIEKSVTAAYSVVVPVDTLTITKP